MHSPIEAVQLSIHKWTRPDEILLGYLIFGSSLQRQMRSGSDIDVFCVVDKNTERQRNFEAFEYEIDLTLKSENRVFSMLRNNPDTNNNYVLHAFTQGTVVFDNARVMARLQDAAHSVWLAGPPALTPAKHKELEAGMRRSTHAVRRLKAKSLRSTNWEALARTQCAVFFTSFVEQYCRANRLWSSSLAILLEFQSETYAEVQALIRLFLEAPHLHVQIDAAVLLGQATLNALERQAPVLSPIPSELPRRQLCLQ